MNRPEWELEGIGTWRPRAGARLIAQVSGMHDTLPSPESTGTLGTVFRFRVPPNGLCSAPIIGHTRQCVFWIHTGRAAPSYGRGFLRLSSSDISTRPIPEGCKCATGLCPSLNFELCGRSHAYFTFEVLNANRASQSGCFVGGFPAGHAIAGCVPGSVIAESFYARTIQRTANRASPYKRRNPQSGNANCGFQLVVATLADGLSVFAAHRVTGSSRT